MIKILEILSREFRIWKIGDDIFKNILANLDPDNAERKTVFRILIRNKVHRDFITDMPVYIRGLRMEPLFSLHRSAQYPIDMYVKFLFTVNGMSKYGTCLFVSAADHKELALFNDMGEIIIRGITPVTKIDSGRIRCVSGIDHFTKCTVFVVLPAWLDNKVRKSVVGDRVKSIYVYLVKPLFDLPFASMNISGSLGSLNISAAEPSQAIS